MLQKLPSTDPLDDVVRVSRPDEGLGLDISLGEVAVDRGLSSTTEAKVPRLRRRFVSLAKKVSTALSHEHEVGVKWKVQRG